MYYRFGEYHICKKSSENTELSFEDRELLERAVVALEKIASAMTEWNKK